MAVTSLINPKTSALLLMDFQGFVLQNFLPEHVASRVVARGAELLTAARARGMMVIHVSVAFRPGYPEISPRNKLFSSLQGTGLVEPGGDGTKIHALLSPSGNEPVVSKHRIGAFSSGDLKRILRANGITTLVLSGVTTAGVVLSTERQAFDLDYELFVASDACADGEADVHTFLVDRVIGQHATVRAAEEIVALLGSALG